MTRTLVAAVRAGTTAVVALAVGLILHIYVSEWIGIPVAVFGLFWGVPTAWRAAQPDK